MTSRPDGLDPLFAGKPRNFRRTGSRPLPSTLILARNRVLIGVRHSMLKRILSKIIRQKRHINLSNGVISRSIAMGMVVGFSPTVGLQLVICFILSFIVNRFRHGTFNAVIALLGSLVVNPLTMVPTYSFYYLLGCQVRDCSTSVEFQDADQIHQLLMLGGDGALTILIGSIPFMVVGLPVGYYLGRLIEKFLERRTHRRRVRLLDLARRRKAETALQPNGSD